MYVLTDCTESLSQNIWQYYLRLRQSNSLDFTTWSFCVML